MNPNLQLNLNDAKERKKFPKESINAIKSLNTAIEKKENEIRCETEKQMQSRLDDIQNEFNQKIKSEMDLFALRNREIENRMQTQELLEKDKLRENLVQRINNMIFDLKNKEKDAELKVMNKQKTELIAANTTHRKEVLTVMEQMYKLANYLEGKLDPNDGNNGETSAKSKHGISTILSKVTSKAPPNQSQHNQSNYDSSKNAKKESEKKHSNREKEIAQQINKEKDQQQRHKHQNKDKKDDKHHNDKKDDKHDNDRKDDKQKPKSNKPWNNMNRFNQ